MKSFLFAGAAALMLLAACDSNNSNNTPTDVDADRNNTRDVDAREPVAPDNTGRNERDRDGVQPTPIDQGNNQADIDITAAIRSAIVDDDAMSTNARNIKIITNGGVVTLRGVVATQAEKDAIETKARAVAGVTRVDNQLEVDTPD